MGGKKPLRRPLWPPTRATASNYYPLGLDGAGGAAKPLLRAPKKPAPLHGRLPAFSGAVDAFERARKCFLEWRYFFSIILSEFLKNRVALQPESKASFLCLVQNKHIIRSVYEASEAILRRVIQVRRNRPIPDEGHRLRLAVLVIRPGHGDCPTIGNAVDGQLHCARSGEALIALRCRFRRLKWSHPRKEAAAESHTVRIKCWPPLAFTFRPRNSNFFSQNYQRHCPFLTDSEKSCIF